MRTVYHNVHERRVCVLCAVCGAQIDGRSTAAAATTTVAFIVGSFKRSYHPASSRAAPGWEIVLPFSTHYCVGRKGRVD